MTKKRLSYTALLLCLLLLLPTVCLAYTTTPDELTQLNSNLTQLAEINSQLSTDLAKSKQDLQTASAQLTQLKLQLTTLQDESSKAKAELIQAQTSLATANGLLTQYEKETNQQIASLKVQRAGLIVAVLYFAIRK